MKAFGWLLVSMSLYGALLNARKDILCFYIWIAANIGWIVYNIIEGIYSQATLFLIYTILCFYGIREWRRDGK